MTLTIFTHNLLASHAIHIAFKGMGKCINTEYLNGENPERLGSSLRKLPSIGSDFLLWAQFGVVLSLWTLCALNISAVLTEKICVNFCLISQGFYRYNQFCAKFSALVFSQIIGSMPTGCSDLMFQYFTRLFR